MSNDQNVPKRDPITNEELTDHDYDGIQELDNPLPGWWLQTFYWAIAFSAVYTVYIHLFDGPTLESTYKAELRQYEDQRLAEAAAAPKFTEESLQEAVGNADVVASGKTIYVKQCATCHGGLGEGGIGPNLADDYWLHGKGELISIAEVIQEGVPAKGMPPWGSLLKPNELTEVTAYVSTLKGTNPPNGKAPQGEKVSN